MGTHQHTEKLSSPPKHQADATLSQANPISGTKYTVLNTAANVRVIAVSIQCTWTVQPSPLELHMTIDGQSLTFTVANPVSTTFYEPHFDSPNAPAAQYLASYVAKDQGRGFLIEGRSVKIEAEITGGTVSNLSARVIYARYV